jgi:hypothetical protein
MTMAKKHSNAPDVTIEVDVEPVAEVGDNGLPIEPPAAPVVSAWKQKQARVAPPAVPSKWLAGKRKTHGADSW